MVGAPTIPELDVFHVVLDTVLVNVVHVGDAAIRPLEGYGIRPEPVLAADFLRVLVCVPVDVDSHEYATDPDPSDVLVGRIHRPKQVLFSQ